jgi:uncharacterized protein YlxW (UPF0749 family)
MAKNIRLIKTFGTLGIVATGLLVGFFVTVQIRASQKGRALNPLSSYAALRDTRESLSLENKLLASENKILSTEITASEKDLKQTEKSSRAKLESLDQLKQLIGLSPKTGEGITIVLADSEKNAVTPNSIAHAADMRDLVNLLWASGAQAISINDQRIVATTSIDCIVNTVMINNVRTVPPFDIRVVGDKRVLAEAALNEKNLPDIHGRVKDEGLVYQVTEQRRLEVPAYNGGFIMEYAK